MLHGFPSLVVHVHAFVVVLHLLQVDIGDQISDLLHGVSDAVRVLLVTLQRAVVRALDLQRGVLFLSESRRDEVASGVVLLRVRRERITFVEHRQSRGPGFVLALQFVSDNALDLRCLACLDRRHWEV